MLITTLMGDRLAAALRARSKSMFVRSLPAALSLTALCLQLSATTIPYKSFNDLMKEADAVVSGHVIGVESQYNAQKEIYTFVTLDNVQVLSGAYQDSTLTIRLKGGQVENDISHIVGSPEFKVDDQVVLFVQGNGRSMVPLVGWTQGLFRVVQDPATAKAVVNDADGNRVVGLQNGAVLRNLINKPEATILNAQTNLAAVQNQVEGDGGSPDSSSRTAPSASAAAAQTNALANAPAMASASFLDTVKASASLRQSKNQLTSVRLMDFSVASANTDAGVGSTVQGAAAATQPLVKPQGKAVPQIKDQE